MEKFKIVLSKILFWIYSAGIVLMFFLNLRRSFGWALGSSIVPALVWIYWRNSLWKKGYKQYWAIRYKRKKKEL